MIALNSTVISCAIISSAVIGCAAGESLDADAELGQLEQALEGPIRAVRDGFYNVDQGQTLVVEAAEGLLANDSGSSPLSVSAGPVSRRGNPIEVRPDGSFTFTPGADFFGEDRIDYVLTDGSGAQKSSGARIVVRPILATRSAVMTGSAGFSIRSGYSDVLGPELEVLGDVNGDGFGDVGIEDYGFFHVIFGKADRTPVQTANLNLGDGFTIEEEGGPSYVWYGELTGLGDVNGDGFNDVGVSSRDYYDYDQLGSGCFVVFGKNDSTTIRLADVAQGHGGFLITGAADDDLGCEILGPGDVNGDGLDDVVVERSTYSEPDVNGIYVIFGKTASRTVDLSDIEDGVGGYPLFGSVVFRDPLQRAGDMNQDGRADFVVALHSSAAPNVAAVVFGKSDTLPGTLDAAVQGGGGFYIQRVSEFEFSSTELLSGGGDVNGDGVPDITLRAEFLTEDWAHLTEAGYVVFGKSDAAPVDLALVSAGVGGFVVDGASDSFIGPIIVDDLNADGRDDLLVSDAGADFMGVFRSGVLYASYGPPPVPFEELQTGVGGFALHGTVEWQSLGFNSATAGDVNADGFGDLLFSVGYDNENYDHIFGMLLGADFTGSVTKMGSPEADTLVASSGAAVADVLVGERGNDRLTSDGGPDVLLGGGGVDRLTIVDADFSRIDAGTGNDVLKLGMDGMALALDEIPSGRLRSIETIDAVGAGANAIRVDVLRAVPLPVGTNTLTLRADASDTATVVRGSASVTTGGGFVTYTRGSFKLRISDVATIVEE